jgi:2-polyprenyl-3-methyl-5-hydroxy-6-metoxy-1,4-benzoquinol methylase
MADRRDQTNQSFRQKWTAGSVAFLDTTVQEKSEIFSWITQRNGFQTPSEFSKWLLPRKRILDAGCGNGRVTNLLRSYSDPKTRIVGVDFSAHNVAKSNFSSLPNTSFEYADLMDDLTQLGSFDLIYCQEVLHHTQDPKKAFFNLVEILEPGGEIAIYVYRKKSEIREFSDDFIREKIEKLNYEEAKEVITQITDFAKSLSQIPESFSFPDLPILGIKASDLTIHRFIYNNVFKNFWNEELSYEENYLINFDWYHPSICSRHTLDEAKSWFTEAKLFVIHSIEDDYGITIRGTKS